MLHAFVLVDAETKKVSMRDYIRAAYMARFGKDIPPVSLEEDLKLFREYQILRQYLVDFAISRIT